MWQKIVKWSIYLLVFLVPLFWLPFSFEAFDFNKLYLLFFLTGLGFLAWLARMIFEDKKVKFKKSPLDIFVFILLFILILSSFFSLDKISTLFGFYGRFWPNLVGIISLVVFYFLLTNNVEVEKKSKKSISLKKILNIFLWSSLFVVIISYLSVFGVWKALTGLPGIMSLSAFNTIGGSIEQITIYLSFIFVFLVSYIAFQKHKRDLEEEKKSLFLHYSLMILILIFLIVVDFWPAFLVTGISLLLFIIFAFWKRTFKEDVNRLSLSVLFLIISLVFLFSNPLSSFLGEEGLALNLPREVQLSQDVSCNVAFKSLKSNPILGSGISTFSYIFSKYKPDSFVQGPLWNVRFDRPSSHLAELLGTTGILGFLGYLALIAMFFIISWFVVSLGKFSSDLKMQFPLIIALTALVIAQVVFYQNLTLAFSFWLFLGLGTIAWRKPQKEKTINFSDLPELGLIVSILFWVILLGVGLFFFNITKSYIADVYYKDYLIKPDNNLVKLKKAVNLNDKRAVYHMALAGGYLNEISKELAKENPNDQLVEGLVLESIKEGRRATDLAPEMVAAKETLGSVYTRIQGLAQGALEWGIKTYKSAIESEPNNPALYTELGRLTMAGGEEDKEVRMTKARSLFNKAIELKENYEPAIIQLASLDLEEDNPEKAVERLENLVSATPFSLNARFQLGRLYYSQREYDKAIRQFQNILSLVPNYSNVIFSLGLTYEAKGDIAGALSQYNKVLELNPGNEMVKRKIEELTKSDEKDEQQENN